jgi:hypothetical protein
MRVFAFSRQAELWPEAKQFERWSTALETRRAASKELATWKLHEHGEEAFNIIAGAFVIEHFHGRTNIRILDSTRVTVESENRGQKSSIAPLGINAAVYQ